MAANEDSKSSPKVSKLPLPISDSPLVIDLPDGQKIVVGKMTQGSVIEVATWRGVGRPDSRTSRLMLGMGNGNVNEESDGSAADGSSPTPRKTQPKPKGFAGFIFSLQQLIKNFGRINWSATFKALFSSLKSKKSLKPKSVNPVTPVNADLEAVERSASDSSEISSAVSVTRASADADIEEWLNKITQKATRDTSATRPAAKKVVKTPAKAKATVKKASPKGKNPRALKKS